MSQQLITVESAAPSEYTTAQVDLIKKTVAVGCSNDELALFLEVCKGSGLNPFMKQIYAIKRGDKMTVQTGIDGYRLLAARTGALAGIDDATYNSEDDAHPAWASVTVWRFVQGHRVPFTAKARWSEYAQVNRDGNPSGLWGKMPFLMLAKCAEALALRKAFPAELSGVYTAEEMDQADNPTTPYVEATPAPAQRATEPTTKEVDLIGLALSKSSILQALNKLGIRNRDKQRAKLEEIKAGLEEIHKPFNGENTLAELERQYAVATSLEGVEMGAPGN